MKLSRRQTTDLVLLAREAWMHAIERGSEDTADQFRRDQVALAVGKNGLSCCENRHYPALMAHFLNYLGRVEEAWKWLQKAASEGERTVAHKIVELCEERGVGLAYAAKIARDMHKSDLEDCSEKQLWNVYFTIKNNAKKTSVPSVL